MAEIPKLDSESDSMIPSCEVRGLDEMENTQKISISDHINGFQYTRPEKSDTFVVDLDGFSHAVDKDAPKNSRISLQRSFSRKGTHRGGGGGEKKAYSGGTAIDRDPISAAPSPRAAALSGESMMREKSSMVVRLGTAAEHQSVNPQVHHQITITAANIGNAESPRVLKRCPSRRSPSSSCFLDPRRVLFFFATLSSMGTILLIYLTLSVGKMGADDDNLNW
ncbi:uncharacterized protein LOC131153577 isoform X2 [Malania oleifera]|uniref:uncharacterized protein LOC131153577 isoform X2 n=1 Tax=Malania oleifera TaxID=397392 RepID=UPI0025AEB63F|nr:uncharacterized protein LOC131153577 isoform X2 [Malania oleifera]